VRSSAKKHPHEFIGDGQEIVGDPTGTNGAGYLLYENGRIQSAHTASLGFDSLPSSKRPKTTPAKEAAWFNLAQLGRKSSGTGAIDQPEEARREATARRLGLEFASAMIEGRLIALISAVTKAHKNENDSRKKRELRRNPADGFTDALWAVAWKSNHPNQVTRSAVMDHLDDHSKFFKDYGITQSMRSPGEVKKWLESIGFGWLPSGRSQGQKRGAHRKNELS
jgi:hypothetical protein